MKSAPETLEVPDDKLKGSSRIAAVRRLALLWSPVAPRLTLSGIICSDESRTHTSEHKTGLGFSEFPNQLAIAKILSNPSEGNASEPGGTAVLMGTP